MQARTAIQKVRWRRKIGHGDALAPSRQSFGALAGAVEGEAASRSTSQRRAAASKTLRTASSGCTVRIGFRRW